MPCLVIKRSFAQKWCLTIPSMELHNYFCKYDVIFLLDLEVPISQSYKSTGKWNILNMTLVEYRVTWCTFWLQPSKKFSRKKFLIFFLKNFTLKKFLIFSPKNFFLIFWEMKLSGPMIKKVLIFSLKSLFLYFGKWNFFKNFLSFRRKLSEIEN